MFCEKCGTKLKEGIKFCPKCGTPVSNATQAPTTQPSTKNKSNTIVVVLIVIIVFSLLIGIIAIIKSSVTGESGSSDDYYSDSNNNDSDDDSIDSDSSNITPAYNEVEYFCYKGLSWDMSYDKVYEILDEMYEEKPSNGKEYNNEEKTFVREVIHNYDGIEGVTATLDVCFVYGQMYKVHEEFNFDEGCGYGLEDVYERLINEYDDLYGPGEDLDFDSTKEHYWMYYDNSNNKVGSIMIQLADYNNNVWISHELEMEVD